MKSVANSDFVHRQTINTHSPQSINLWKKNKSGHNTWSFTFLYEAFQNQPINLPL